MLPCLSVRASVPDTCNSPSSQALAAGATSSVHAWDRVAKLILKIARVILRLPVLAYVDDFLGAEWPETVEHANEVFARLVRVLLGRTALQQKKMDHGSSMEVLGLIFDVNEQGVWCKPCPQKVAAVCLMLSSITQHCTQVAKWSGILEAALDAGVLNPGAASKLAGKLVCNSGCAFVLRCRPRCSKLGVATHFSQTWQGNVAPTVHSRQKSLRKSGPVTEP